MSHKPKFRVMRQGYDRFEVDQMITNLEHDKTILTKQIELYQKQVESLQEQRDIIKKRYQQLVSESGVREKAAEEMSRLALREANSIIDTAYMNADMIVREAMSTSRQVLVEIARISNESNELRDELKEKLMELEVAIDDLTLPDAPNSKLIGEDQDKLGR
ncbi:DivIVA domain-containing protein [Erysipelothrix rhusiopathiae]|uniref:DivIVA domain-containing protein n=2 Tax=Erysipelothrix rhusiopathiae TaxID=1648 RepID=UPI000210B79D|nr:DivIVA domain-containing protein [Erysipelothrix rhusiopathiae]AGN24289.1 cell-division initiation protein DivIVA [Erysipelothrix rhusiopathiae SY1027]AMS10949.1 cell division protein DivIVA [Erysipelothrix rhusiopathiae]AOO66779.1 cell division protein DivIVA [Erysipelothrix rhusiopathiae]MCG4436333.1 DivIVA domain-containing protein [Erysipelothrix rhusiopathiae]MCG4456248.1 DivIVA domain-containing protein [Erysipelothrix rhusiopathiae]